MKRNAIAILFATALVMLFASRPVAAGGHRRHHGHGGSSAQRYSVQRYNAWTYSEPIYHGSSSHFDSRYHVDSYDWTPRQGIHTHGHYDVTPHFTPRHFDYGHVGHIDTNPDYHH